MWNPESRIPEIIFWEDPKNGCHENNAVCNNLVGTYIVNSGDCLHGSSTILTENGWKPIQNIVKNRYQGKVRCVDNQGKLVVSRTGNAAERAAWTGT